MIFLCTVFLLFGLAGVAGAIPEYLPGAEAGFVDVEQASGSDYCWAATSANLLAFTGWDGGFTSGTDIYGEFTDSFTDVFGNPYYGINWWFDGTNDAGAGWPQASSGFAYYTEALFNSAYGWDEDPAGDIPVMDYVEYNMDNNRPWVMLVGYNNAGVHWLTGYGTDDTDDDNVIDGVYVTDSLDGTSALQYQPLTYGDNRWYMNDYNNDWYVISMGSLAMNSSPYVAPNEKPSGVPEPATMLLLGTSLLGLAYFSKKRKQS